MDIFEKINAVNEIGILRIIALASLIIGFIGSMTICYAIGYPVLPGYYTLREIYTPGIILGLAVLFQSIVVWAVLNVISNIAENLQVIKDNTTR